MIEQITEGALLSMRLTNFAVHVARVYCKYGPALIRCYANCYWTRLKLCFWKAVLKTAQCIQKVHHG